MSKRYKDLAKDKILNILQNNPYKEQIEEQNKEQLTGQKGKQIEEQNKEQLTGQKGKQIEEQNKEQLTGQKGKQIEGQNLFYWITEKQAAVLHYLILQKNCITTLNDISKKTGIAYGTVRKAINRLVENNCITKPKRFRNGRFHGIQYSLNKKICQKFHPEL